MILGLDISTSITGATVINENGKVVYNEAWDLRKYKEFFQKAEVVKGDNVFPMIPAGAAVADMIIEEPPSGKKLEKPVGST